MNQPPPKVDTSPQVDREKIRRPHLRLTKRAARQISLIRENDFTLTGECFRLQVGGKGCQGFEYATGFTAQDAEDFVFTFPHPDEAQAKLTVVMDPFVSFYLQNAEVDYRIGEVPEEEGFVVINHSQEQFHGKFWKSDAQKVPPMKKGP